MYFLKQQMKNITDLRTRIKMEWMLLGPQLKGDLSNGYFKRLVNIVVKPWFF